MHLRPAAAGALLVLVANHPGADDPVLRARRRTLKLLCVSGYPNVRDSALTSDFLAKPFSNDVLATRIRELLARGSETRRS